MNLNWADTGSIGIIFQWGSLLNLELIFSNPMTIMEFCSLSTWQQHWTKSWCFTRLSQSISKINHKIIRISSLPMKTSLIFFRGKISKIIKSKILHHLLRLSLKKNNKIRKIILMQTKRNNPISKGKNSHFSNFSLEICLRP